GPGDRGPRPARPGGRGRGRARGVPAVQRGTGRLLLPDVGAADRAGRAQCDGRAGRRRPLAVRFPACRPVRHDARRARSHGRPAGRAGPDVATRLARPRHADQGVGVRGRHLVGTIRVMSQYPGPDPDDPFSQPPNESGTPADQGPPPADAGAKPEGSGVEETAPIQHEEMGYWEKKALEDQARLQQEANPPGGQPGDQPGDQSGDPQAGDQQEGPPAPPPPPPAPPSYGQEDPQYGPQYGPQ